MKAKGEALGLYFSDADDADDTDSLSGDKNEICVIRV